VFSNLLIVCVCFFFYYQVGISQFGVLDDVKHYLILKVDSACSSSGAHCFIHALWMVHAESSDNIWVNLVF
jgi:hypothetical protein